MKNSESERMMNEQECIMVLDDIETTFSMLFDEKLAGFNDIERGIAARIIDDTVNLIKDVNRDVYMFGISYDNYNNGFSFMPQYYFENILLHDDMIWERIIIIIAIAYQIDFQIIFKKKSISHLYDIIKKDNSIDIAIKKSLQEINADFKMREFKFNRNENEHYISTHLAENDKIKSKYNDIIYIENGELHGNLDKINQQTDIINREVMRFLKKKIVVVNKKQDKYINLLKLCIVHMGCAFKKSSFYFNQIKYFVPEKKAIPENKDIYANCDELEKKYAALREEFRIVVDIINESVFDTMNKSSMIRNTLLTDSIFRAKEIIRSINLYFSCTSFYIYGEKQLEPNQKEAFKKYCCNDVVFSYYYYDHAVLKFYSVYEKLAKFLICKYDFNRYYLDDSKFKGMYIENVIEILKKKGINSEILVKFQECVSSNEFIDYEKTRNKAYHCLRTYFFLDEKCRDRVIITDISQMTKMMYSLHELFSMIIEEEKRIYTEMIRNKKK